VNKKHSDDKESTGTPIRVDKTLTWLRASRDSWKEKTKESKTKLKIATLGLKRVREERDKIETEFKEDRCNIQQQLDQKDTEIVLLKNQLEQATREIENLKKKK
jgi:hypothetical protein